MSFVDADRLKKCPYRRRFDVTAALALLAACAIASLVAIVLPLLLPSSNKGPALAASRWRPWFTTCCRD